MNADQIVAQVTATGCELTDKRRNPQDSGWSLQFSNGAKVEVADTGAVSVSGKGADDLRSTLGLSASG